MSRPALRCACVACRPLVGQQAIFLSVSRASRVAPLRFPCGGLRRCVGHPGVTSGAPTFPVRRFVAVCRSSGLPGWRSCVSRAAVRDGAAVFRASRVAPLRFPCGGLWRCVGFPGVTSGASTFPVRWFAAVRRSSGRHEWRPYVSRAAVCGGVSVSRALRVASLRFPCGGLWRCVGFPGVTSGAPTFPVRWLVAVCRFSGRHKWRPYVSRAAVCGGVSVLRASGVAFLRILSQ